MPNRDFRHKFCVIFNQFDENKHVVSTSKNHVGRYSKDQYSLKPLNCHISFKPKNSETKNYLNTIHNQITFTIQKLNLITEHRVELVNEYRKLDLKHDELLHQKTFEKKDTKSAEELLKQRSSPVLNHIVINTEIYFLYAKILLDNINDIIHYYEDELPKNCDHSFSKTYYHIIQNGCKNRHLQHVFQNDLNWHPLMIDIPRNKLLVHDQTTSGISWNDHGIDISVAKTGWDHISDDDVQKLLKIVKNYEKEFPIDANGGYNQPVLREFIRKPEVFTHDEILTIADVSKRYPIFPYIADVHPRLQKFLDFMSTMVQITEIEGYW